MTTVQITILDDTLAKVEFAFDPAVVALVKSMPKRWWDKPSRAWFIPPVSVAHLTELLKRNWHTVYASDLRPPKSTPPPVRTANANWAVELLSRCNAEQREKVFRALTRVLHPDAGGSTQLMTELNGARDRIR